MHKRYSLITLTLLASTLACSMPGLQSTPTEMEKGVPTQVAETLTAMAPAPTSTFTPLPPSPTPPQPLSYLWICPGCVGTEAWKIEPGGAQQIQLPVSMGQYYDYSAGSHRILFAQEFADHGAGPGNVAVSDLAILDVASGEVEVIHQDGVVEALWGPDGHSFAYILATAQTYELHWRDGGGEDRLITDDITFTWSVSPDGRWIAFTRETGYEVEFDPGFYIVSVESGEERKLSEVDKSGTGSIEDRPHWSTDSQEVILSAWGGPETARTVLAAVDGSYTINLQVDPAVPEDWWTTDTIPTFLWHPNGEHLLAVPLASREHMGGPNPLVLYRLNRQEGTLEGGALLAEIAQLIGWDVPGHSVWAMDPDSQVPIRIELP